MPPADRARPWRRRWLAGLVLPLTACTGTDDTGPTTVVPSVTFVVLGDSLTYQSTESLLEIVPAAVVDAFPGRSMVVPFVSDTGLSRVPDLPLDSEADLVVALGTNDAGYAGYPPDQLQANLDELLDALGRDRCITWVLPYVRAPRPTEEIAEVEAFGARLRAEMSSLACGAVLDWPAVVSADPTLITDDGAHLTPAGEDAFAALIASAVR